METFKVPVSSSSFFPSLQKKKFFSLSNPEDYMHVYLCECSTEIDKKVYIFLFFPFDKLKNE